MRQKRTPPEGSVRRVQHIDGNCIFTLTNKMGRTVQCESFQERKLVLWFERDKTIKDYAAQPETLRFINSKGKLHPYTPDFKVWRDNGQIEIHEVTLNKRREEKWTLKEREEAAKQICESRGWKYKVHTEDVLPNDTEVANLLSVRCFSPMRYRNSEVAAAIHESLARLQHPYTENFEANLIMDYGFNKQTVHCTLFNMLWHGELESDWQKLMFFEVHPARSMQIWLAATEC